MTTLSTIVKVDLPTLLSSDNLPILLELLDDFLTRGTSLQSCADNEENQVAAARALASESRAVFSLFASLAEAPASLLQLAFDCGLLHVTRLVPFCQLYGVKNARMVAAILDALVDKVAGFSTMLPQLRDLYIQQLEDLETAALACRRNQVCDLIRHCAELCFSIGGITSADAVTAVVLLNEKNLDAALASPTSSLLFRLLQCYESTVPTLQRHIVTLDDASHSRWLSMIATIRLLLLHIVERCLDLEVQRIQSFQTDTLLAGFYALSTGSINKSDAEHGSFLSDLWFLCHYQDKIRNVFDSETFGYLVKVIHSLPRRQILSKPINNVPGSTALTPDHELVSKIRQVQEVLPTVGDGYVALCLLTSQMQVESVLHCLLENHPPDGLQNVPQNLTLSDPTYSDLKAQFLVTPFKPQKSTKLDPRRVWIGKKTNEKSYDPQVATQDQQLVEKVKQLVTMYENEENEEEEEELATLDALIEYDDEFTDEFEDVVPLRVLDSGNIDDQDAIREENRKIRAKEEKQAFWEAMRNRNREQMETTRTMEGSDEKEEKSPEVPCRGQSTRESETKPTEALTPQQIQRQRARKDKNKAKVANHHRKERAIKKRGG